MVKIENDCVDCATDGFPCLRECCPYRNITHYYCDECGDDVDILWETEKGQLCLNCLADIKTLTIILDSIYDRVE